MKNTIKVVAVALLIFTGIVALINNLLDKDLKNKFETLPEMNHEVKVSVSTESANNEDLDFYSNEFISFYYPKEWSVTEKKRSIGYSIIVQSDDDGDFNQLSIGILDNTLSKEEALNSVLKGFFKGFEDYKIQSSQETTFMGSTRITKRFEVTKYTLPIKGEAFAFEKGKKTFTFIKLSESIDGLKNSFSDIENSFKVLSANKSETDATKNTTIREVKSNDVQNIKNENTFSAVSQKITNKINPAAVDYYNLGMTEYRLGNYRNAHNLFEKAISVDSTYVEAHLQETLNAIAFMEKEKFYGNELENLLSFSIKNICDAIEMDQNNPRIYLNTSFKVIDKIQDEELLRRKEEYLYVQVIKSTTKAIERDQNNPEAFLLRGILKMELSDYFGAIEDLSISLKQNESFDAYLYRAKAYFYKGNDFKSIKDYTKALEFDKDNAEVYYLRGSVKEGLLGTRAAYKDFSKAGELGHNGAYTAIEYSDSFWGAKIGLLLIFGVAGISAIFTIFYVVRSIKKKKIKRLQQIS